MGTVQAVCNAEVDCGKNLAEYDQKEKRKCFPFYQNVQLHNIALERYESARRLVDLGLSLSGDFNRGEDFAARLKSRLFTFKNDLEAMKDVYRVLKAYKFPCSYNVEAAQSLFPVEMPLQQ